VHREFYLKVLRGIDNRETGAWIELSGYIVHGQTISADLIRVEQRSRVLVPKPQRLVDDKDMLVAFTMFVKGPDRRDRDAGETLCRAVEGTNIHASTCFLNQDAISTSHRGICMRI
jgi:hypothetical protein